MSANHDNLPHPPGKQLSFENTEIAFRGKSSADLERAYWLFKIISVNFLTRIGPPITNFAMKIGLPLRPLIKATIFKHFCGGETIEECEKTIQQLDNGNVGAILDYSIEGEDNEQAFDSTAAEIRRTVERADGDDRIPFSVFKVTGIARFGLLEKAHRGEKLNSEEQAEYLRVHDRVNSICELAHQLDVPVMIDAEESWIQGPIDELTMEMMKRYNQERGIVITTYQLYRNDKLKALESDLRLARREGFILGAKLVRGAYMEKERERAIEMGYPTPIHESKEATDADYNDALKLCINDLAHVSLVAGTHNEESCRILVEMMNNKSIQRDTDSINFSQLLGMSDNLSFNLSAAGFNVVKYVPYGPVKSVLPYLFRRAKENTSVAGQMGRELRLIEKEKKRRSASVIRG